MLDKKQIDEIREHLNNSQSPLFFFDNDQDGLCSFLLLQRYLSRGRGVAVKGSPMDANYFQRVQDLEADCVFILDIPTVSKEFFEEIEKINMPVVWIDHHGTDDIVPEFVNYYNTFGKGDEPTTDICYNISDRKDDLWLAVVGCIADRFYPSYYKEFLEKYIDLGIDSDDPFEIYYSSQIGEISRIFGYALKNRTTEVVNFMKYMMKIRTPYEIFEDFDEKIFFRRVDELRKRQKKLIDRAREEADDSNLLFFEYGGETSMSAFVANELSYLYPGKIIVVAYNNGIKANISMRGKNVKKILLEVLEDFPSATGGGHEEAVGSQISVEDLQKFREILISKIN